MTTLGEIERLTHDYADSENAVAQLVSEMESELDRIRIHYLDRLIPLSTKAAQEKAVLVTAIKESPGLFESPRSYTFHGIKVGYQKQKGKVVINDEEKTIELIQKKLPELEDNLVKYKASVIKSALNSLSVADLRKIAVEIEDDKDEVLIKSDRDKIMKFINSLIDEKTAAELGAA